MAKKKYSTNTQKTSFAVPSTYVRKEDYIHFSLSRIETGKYCFKRLNKREKAKLIDSIYSRRHFTWLTIQDESNLTIGYEMLPTKGFKPTPPDFITPEMKELMVFRFGKDGRMAGYKKEHIFYIVWLDCTFKLYDHGS